MTLDSADIQFITALVKEQIRLHLDNKPKSKQRDYWSTNDVRQLIENRLSELRDRLGDEEWNIHVIRSVLKQYMKLGPSDLEKQNGDKQPRWEIQVNNALSGSSDVWRNNPFVRGDRRGTWRLKPAGDRQQELGWPGRLNAV